MIAVDAFHLQLANARRLKLGGHMHKTEPHGAAVEYYKITLSVDNSRKSFLSIWEISTDSKYLNQHRLISQEIVRSHKEFVDRIAELTHAAFDS
jgi:hypothetical protein